MHATAAPVAYTVYGTAATIGVAVNVFLVDTVASIPAGYLIWLFAAATVLPVYLFRVYTGPVGDIHDEQKHATIAITFNVIIMAAGLYGLFRRSRVGTGRAVGDWLLY